jgi:hypothetical protein
MKKWLKNILIYSTLISNMSSIYGMYLVGRNATRTRSTAYGQNPPSGITIPRTYFSQKTGTGSWWSRMFSSSASSSSHDTSSSWPSWFNNLWATKSVNQKPLAQKRSPATYPSVSAYFIDLFKGTKEWVSPRRVHFPTHKDFDIPKAKEVVFFNRHSLNTLVNSPESNDVLYWDLDEREIPNIDRSCTTLDIILSEVFQRILPDDELLDTQRIDKFLELMWFTKQHGGELNSARGPLYINGLKKLKKYIKFVIDHPESYEAEKKKNTLLKMFDSLYDLLLECLPDVINQIEAIHYKRDPLFFVPKDTIVVMTEKEKNRAFLLEKFNLPSDASDQDIVKKYWSYRKNNQDSPEEVEKIIELATPIFEEHIGEQQKQRRTE